MRALAAISAPKRLPRRSPLDTRHKLTRVYVQGITRMPISELKKHLRTLRFMTSKIANVSFVDNNIVEFLLDPTYFASFRGRLRHVDSLSILPAHDPSCPRDAKASPKVKENVHRRFVDRLHKTAATTSIPEVRQYFIDWCASIGAPVPSNATPGPSGGAAPPPASPPPPPTHCRYCSAPGLPPHNRRHDCSPSARVGRRGSRPPPRTSKLPRGPPPPPPLSMIP